MKNADKDMMVKAAQIVQKYDPATYQAMRDAKYRVTTSWHEINEWSGQDETDIKSRIEAKGAFGMTPKSGKNAVSFINLPLVRFAADTKLHVPVEYFLADVIVHEFTHTGQKGHFLFMGSPKREVEAFDKGTQFAHKLPPEYGVPIARESDKDELQAKLALAHGKTDKLSQSDQKLLRQTLQDELHDMLGL